MRALHNLYKAATALCVAIALAVVAEPRLPLAGATETPDQIWTETVLTLTDAIRSTDPTAAAQTLESIPVRRFGTDAPARPVSLLAHTGGGRVISARAYSRLPETLASDLAADFTAAADLPERIRRRFVPASPEQHRQANALAADWVRESLRLTRQCPVAVVVLWCGDSDLPSASTDPADDDRKIVFVMIRGEADADGSVHPRQLVFGNPLTVSR